MVLCAVSQRVICRSQSLRRSYFEISRYIRRCGHGTNQHASFPPTGLRWFSTDERRAHSDLNEKQIESLELYKQTINRALDHEQSKLTKKFNNIEVGAVMALTGYLSIRRDVSKKLSFAMLRDPSQNICIQLVSSSDGSKQQETRHSLLKGLKEWTPVLVKGIIKKRQPAQDASFASMTLINERELEVTFLQPLNDLSEGLVLKEETVFPPEQRHLQLRINRDARHTLQTRALATKQARWRLSELGFIEVETPVLFKSTPEGAREFVVPTRDKGLAYALPQSPQQYKQILMASGIDKYYQFARCFRDEDLRADRQPEFTQLDIEMAFAGEYAVQNVIENVLYSLGHRLLASNWIERGRVPRMTYQEAMASYGSDKPDLRFDMKEIVESPGENEIPQSVKGMLPQDLISKITPLESPIIEAFKLEVSNNPSVTRKFIKVFLDSPEGKPYLDNPAGQPGVFVSDVSQPLQGLGALGHQFVLEMPEALSVDQGGLLILQARKIEPFYGGSTPLGNLRLALHKAAVAQGLLPAPEGFKFVWIHDFPLFTPSNDIDPGQGGSAGFSSTHHPFTAPKTKEDVDLLFTAPEKAIAAHYDIVVNGVELGGGSRRIHNAEVQEIIFRNILKMSDKRIEDFRHLLDVLRSGCPPHSGIALGWDRLMAVMLGKDSVRDVIAFPKSGKGEDLLVKSPTALTLEQLETYHLQLKE